jgi:Mrp family chromosome partitioning ATPase
MSKNFELLQRIGNAEALFETVIEADDAVPAAKDESSLALDKETFERIMLNASLPDVFETVTEPLPGTFEEWSDPRPNALGESKANVSQVDDYATVFRPSGNATSWFDDFENFVEKNSAQNAVESPSSAETAAKEQKLPSPTRSSGVESTAVPRKRIRQSVRPKFSPSFQWIEGIKRVANKWERKPPARGSQQDKRIDAIAREEEFKLVQRVFPGTTQGSPRVALFAGLESESGCGSICVRAGKILATRAEGPVCVVDANFQAPSLHEYFGVENCKGLTEATVESGPIQNFAQQIPEHDLWLLPSGTSATELRFPTMAEGLRERIKELRETFRYVVIHSGPLRLQTSAMQLSRWTDGIVLVVEANNTRKEAARRVKDNLAAANVSVLGVVLNNRAFPIPDAIYRRL